MASTTLELVFGKTEVSYKQARKYIRLDNYGILGFRSIVLIGIASTINKCTIIIVKLVNFLIFKNGSD